MESRVAVKPRHLLLFLGPAMVGMAVFYIIPFLASLMISLTEWDGLQQLGLRSIPPFIGLENYRTILGGPELRRVLGNTIYFIALYIPLVLAASLIVALLMAGDRPGVVALRIGFYIPVLTSWVAGALIWRWVLSPEYGPVNAILGAVGLPQPGWLQDRRWAMPAIVLASVWKDMGFFGMILLGGLQSINPALYEAAEIDGASRPAQFRRITLPMLSPVTFFVVVIGLINSFQLFPQVMIMTENAGPQGATQVMVERIYTYAFRYYEMGYAAALSWVLFVIIFICTLIQLRLQKAWVHYG